MIARRRRLLPLALAALAWTLALPLALEASRRRTPRKSPHAEITGVARVDSVPRRRTHSNGREFEEFDGTLVSAAPTPDQSRGADPNLSLDGNRRVHVVHDLSCGGSWEQLAPGDHVEFKGEYVQTTGGGRDILHFTHPSGGSCGRGDGHPSGYLRRR